MKFEWNEEKAALNLEKHGVAFEEASTVFADPLAWTFPDPDHSLGESRFITMGLGMSGKLLVVAHTEWEQTFRIVSARPATAQERKRYEA